VQDQSINSYLFIGVIFCWHNSPGLNSKVILIILYLAGMESLVLRLGDRFASLIDMTISKEGVLEAFDCTIKLENIELDFAFASKIVLMHKNIFFICPNRKNLNFCL
jgi:hypothetical protein